MHEWLEALQKSAKSKSPGVAAEELQRAETEAGAPLPGELGDLYAAFNGGAFEGEVVLYPLHGEGEQASVLEKTRKMLVGLPGAGVWRFGLKGTHRHLFTARKSAMVEQGDAGWPLPEWVQALGDEDWIYCTWDDEKKEMKFYRSLSNMLNVLVPPVEHEEFGDRTFARAIAAVQGALSKLAGGEEGKEAAEGEEKAATEGAEEEPAEVAELAYEYEEGVRPKVSKAAAKAMKAATKPPKAASKAAEAAPEAVEAAPQAAEAAPVEAEPKLDKPAVIAAERRVKNLKSKAGKKEVGLDNPAVIAAERRIEGLKTPPSPEQAAVPRKKAAARTAAKQAPVAEAPAKKAPAKKAAVKQAPTKKAPAKRAAVQKAAAKKAPAKKAAAKKAPAKKAAAKKTPAKKAAAKKAPARKAPAKKAAAKKAPAKKAAAKKAGARRNR